MRKIFSNDTLAVIMRALIAVGVITPSVLLVGCGDDLPRQRDDAQLGVLLDTAGTTGLGDVAFRGMDGLGGSDVVSADTQVADTQVADTQVADTLSPDALSPDALSPDALSPDALSPDALSPVSPDSTVADAGTFDIAGPDATEPDATQGDVTQADGGDGGSVDPNSCAGRCGKYNAKASCQCDSYCATAGDCCKDLGSVCGCVGAGCCTKASDCDDKLGCTADSCDSKGSCAHVVQSGQCAIDAKCVADGANSGSVCAVCDAKQDAKQWTLKPAGTGCDDGQVCTTGDMCDASGGCSGKAKSGCCTSDSACATSTACQLVSCDKASGTCKFSAQPGCCSAGVCCDVAGGTAKAKQSPCGSKPVATAYRCQGAQVQKRQALAGCDGSSGTTCSTKAAYLAWGAWKTIQSCGVSQTCQLSSADKAPLCVTPGGGCVKVKDCDDSNPCTVDACVGGKCSNQTKVGCCVFASDCDDGNGCTVDSCVKNACGHSAKSCSAPSACETGLCDVKSGVCGGAVKAASCKIDGACYASGAKHPTDSCLRCEPSKSQSAWTVTAACACSGGVCCDAPKKRIKTKASQCDNAVQTTEYSCSADGAQVLTRHATRGCTGKSNTCSISKSNWHWSAWSPSLACAKGEVCEVKGKHLAGACVSGGVASCNPAVTNACCTAQGKVAPKLTPCDTPIVKSELSCSTSAPGGQLLQRYAVAGCTGASDTCSSAYLAWGKWKLKLQCGKTQVCGVSPGAVTGGCEAAKQCDPKLACCSAAGAPLAKGTACASPALTQYRCALSGAAVETRTATGVCLGDGSTCNTAQPTWSTWAASVTCSSSTVCTVGDDGSPGCATPPGVDCKKTDKWEGVPTTTSSKSVGSYTDASASLILSPKVHLNGATDKDYLTYKLTDASATHEPRVHIEWSGKGAVMVCAYIRCTKASDGKSCAPVVCPSGTISYKNSAVSGVAVNGCCATLAKGTIDYAYDAPKTTDESGEVYFNVLNKAPFCQEIDVKLGFGAPVKAQCNPTATCCDSGGNFVKKGTQCGATALATAYQCSSLALSGNVQVRKSYAGCSGVSSTCGTATGNRVWSSWSTAINCTSSQLCVVADPTKPGSCVASNNALCKAPDKWEGPINTSQSINLGSVTDDADAVMVAPMVHLGLSDVDYLKLRIVDNFNTVDPVVNISWTAASTVTVCAYYRCLLGANKTDCAPVVCPAGAQTYFNSAVSGVVPNGCCMTGKTGTLAWMPDTPGLLNIDETGWLYFNVKNKAPICQRANIKLTFGGSAKVCGDGKCEAGESSSCPQDCGSCANSCGAKYNGSKPCQCDALCASAGDCCWNKPLLCGD